jgi:hypothetical protein
MAFEGMIYGNLTAGWKGAAECGDVFNVTPEFDFFGEECVAGRSVFWALVGKVCLVLCGEFCGRGEIRVVSHWVLLDQTHDSSADSNNAQGLLSQIFGARSSIRPFQHCV